MNGERLFGSVKFFNDAKGFGFIKQDNGSDDIFFHRTDLPEGVREVDDGVRISFEIATNKKGPRAVDIRFERSAP